MSKRIRIWIDSDEAYPVFSFNTTKESYDGKGVLVDEQKIKKWNKVWDAYGKMQNELEALSNR